MIIDGRNIALNVKDEVKEQVNAIKKKLKLVIIQVGDNMASSVYVRNKTKACEYVGIEAVDLTLSASTSEKELLATIDKLNHDNSVTAIMVQLPLPDHLDEKTIINRIDPLKDADGLTSINQGRLFNEEPCITPATPKGVMELLRRSNVILTGANVAMVGYSLLVGKTLSVLLTQKRATVTICRSRTQNLGDILRRQDVVIVAVGHPGLVAGKDLKTGAVVIDVGINKVDGKLVGDVDFESASPICSLITPVPGGCGPMTVACLMQNVVDCYNLQNNK